jgi:hypothetical protein
VLDDGRAILFGHLQAVDHHQRSDCNIESAAAEPQHFGDLGILEMELAVQLIVLLVEGAASNEQADRRLAWRHSEPTA